jgi:hypothetical protein
VIREWDAWRKSSAINGSSSDVRVSSEVVSLAIAGTGVISLIESSVTGDVGTPAQHPGLAQSAESTGAPRGQHRCSGGEDAVDIPAQAPIGVRPRNTATRIAVRNLVEAFIKTY